MAFLKESQVLIKILKILKSLKRWKICAITAGIKKYRPVIKKKLNSTEILICKALNDSYVSLYEFVSVNDALKKYDEMKEKIKI